MPGVRETIAGLTRIDKAMKRPSDRGDDAGLSEVRGFGFNPGRLRMLVHVPEGLAPNAPLVVVLHGCTQRAGSHARAAGWVALADRLEFVVLAPEQASENNPSRCFNWFEPGDIARNSGEAASIHAKIRHLMRAHALARFWGLAPPETSPQADSWTAIRPRVSSPSPASAGSANA